MNFSMVVILRMEAQLHTKKLILQWVPMHLHNFLNGSENLKIIIPMKDLPLLLAKNSLFPKNSKMFTLHLN